MAKVSTVSLTLNGKSRVFEVHYSARNSEFSVHLGKDVEAIAGTATGATEREAREKAQAVLRKYEDAAKTKRRVILVYAPDKHAFSRFTYNGIGLDCAEVTISFRVLDEVTLAGQREFITDNGRAEWVSGKDFAVIEWTPEREAFFARAVESLQSAKTRIRDFLAKAEANPELCEGSGALLLGGRES